MIADFNEEPKTYFVLKKSYTLFTDLNLSMRLLENLYWCSLYSELNNREYRFYSHAYVYYFGREVLYYLNIFMFKGLYEFLILSKGSAVLHAGFNMSKIMRQFILASPKNKPMEDYLTQLGSLFNNGLETKDFYAQGLFNQIMRYNFNYEQ
jgi:hypothetical protein